MKFYDSYGAEVSSKEWSNAVRPEEYFVWCIQQLYNSLDSATKDEVKIDLSEQFVENIKKHHGLWHDFSKVEGLFAELVTQKPFPKLSEFHSFFRGVEISGFGYLGIEINNRFTHSKFEEFTSRTSADLQLRTFSFNDRNSQTTRVQHTTSENTNTILVLFKVLSFNEQKDLLELLKSEMQNKPGSVLK